MLKRTITALLFLGATTHAWAAVCTAPEGAGANVVNLTTRGSSGTVNGAFFEQIDPRSTGSGVIDPFVRVNPGGSANCEHGYNTSHRKLEFDENSSPTFTPNATASLSTALMLATLATRSSCET